MAKPPPAATDIFSADNSLTPQIDLTAPVEEALDVFSIDDEDTPGIDLAAPLPAAGRGRAAATASGRTGVAARGIHIRRWVTLPSQTGAIARLLLAAVLLVGLALAQAFLSPKGIETMRALFGGASYLLYAGATSLSLVALVLVAGQGMRRVSYSLFLAAIGATVLTAACAAVTLLLAAPGVLPATFRRAILVAAPWSVVAIFAGLGAFAFLRGRRLDREQEDEREWSRVLQLSSFVAAGGLIWVLLQPRASLAEVNDMTLVPFEPKTEQQLARLAAAAAGAQAVAARPLLRPSHSAEPPARGPGAGE